jgi:hypothetical protein
VRYLVTATMAASVLAIGLKVAPAQSLPLGDTATGADSAIQKVQREGKGGGGGPAAGGGGGGQGGPAAREGGGGDAMRGGGGMREGGAQFRSERGMRENGGARLRAERGTRGERGVEFGYRDRRHGRRDGGVFIERGYGYAPGGGCGWLRQRALATDSPYWWRRYRACRGL